MSATVLVVFTVVYAGMVLGRVPRLKLDRTGIALLGAIALVGAGELTLPAAAAAVDVPTIALLFAFMVLSAQLRLGGFYTRVVERIAALPLPPGSLLAAVVFGTGLLAAVFTNDIVCLAAAPVLIRACAERRLDPMPFLLALACAANVGSAATLIGNPQNILIGQVLDLSFAGYLLAAGPPALLGLVATWAIIAWQHRGAWELPAAAPPVTHGALPAFDRWQTVKGLAATAFLFVAFLAGDVPREVLALGAAGVLLCSRKLHSREMLGLVDWQLLVLFAGLFVVHAAMERTGVPQDVVRDLRTAGVDPSHPVWLFTLTVGLSNVVSNVPAVMLLLPVAGTPFDGTLLALVSTLAGNLLLVGSIANLIVADVAEQHGLRLDWRRHARTGVPVSIATLGIAALHAWWLAVP